LEIRAGRLTVPEASDLAKLPKQARSSVLRQANGGNGKLTRVIRQAELDYRHRSAQRAARNGKPKTRYGKIEIWCGDCVALMNKRIKPKSVDVVVPHWSSWRSISLRAFCSGVIAVSTFPTDPPARGKSLHCKSTFYRPARAVCNHSPSLRCSPGKI
jgi:hypothetical protein